MAFIYKPNHSKTFRIGFKQFGKFKSVSTGTTDFSQAKKFKKDFEAKQRLNLIRSEFERPQDHKIKLSEAVEIFFNQKELAESSKTTYRIAIDHLIKASGDKFLFQYSNNDFFKLIDSFRKNKTHKGEVLSKNSTAIYSRHIYALFNFLLKENFIKENPMRRIPPDKKEVEPVPPVDLEIILQELKRKKMLKQFNFISLIYFCAFRLNEAINAEAEDFDLKRRTVRVRNQKGKRIDFIPMPEDLFQFLIRSDLPKAGRLFDYKCNSSVKSFWKTVNKTCGFNYKIHQIRKARGTDLANAGVEPLFLQKFMRHSDFRTTQQYYLKIDLQKAAADINAKIAEASKRIKTVDLKIVLN